jgi:beta-glucosidase
MALKGFQRVKLAPGETKTISFTITPGLLQMLNKDMQWVVEPGAFTVMIGASSADVRLSEILTVK